MITVVDWRTVPVEAVAPCYEAELAAWSTHFLWDTQDTWRQVELARSAGTLPGLLARDADAEVGWCFYLRHHGTLQIGGVTAREDGVLAALLDRTLASTEARASARAIVFVPDLAADLGGLLRARGFRVRPFSYLVRPLVDWRETEAAGRSYHAGRRLAAADLLSRAYPGSDPSRPFAPSGRPEDWLEYTGKLVDHTACGRLLPWASVVEEDAAAPGRLLGAVLTTAIGPQTGHIAQVAVDAEAQGRGTGGRLLRAALTRLRDRGFTHASLLVADDNQRAHALYTRMGFGPHGRFLSAWRDGESGAGEPQAARSRPDGQPA